MSLYATLKVLLEGHDAFSSQAAIDAMEAVPWVPIAAVSAYVVFVFGGQRFMKHREPLNLRSVNTVWNLFLAAFSILGAVVTVPFLLAKFRAEGLAATSCTAWYFEGGPGLWMALFAWSKIFEFFDTVLLVLQKKPVIFLHWYHHVTVMLYCWYAYMLRVPEGLWYCAMNYFVHAIMYSYYFLMTRKAARPHVKPFAPLITFLQIAQMVVGISVAVYAGAVIRYTPGCQHYPVNNALCIAMYASYFLLFTQLFHKNYIKGNKHRSEAKAPSK